MNVDLTEDRIPLDRIEETVEELVELYGGELKAHDVDNERRFVLPLRRGVATSGGVECTLSWAPDGTVRMRCDRDVDAPKVQRVLMLIAGVVGAVLFMLWPFYPAQREWGTLAWIGGAIALAVYFLTLRRTSGGIANDFLQRLARRQRAVGEGEQTISDQ
jgi:hypothetical protein